MVESIMELRKKCQPKESKLWLDRFMRKFSIYLTKLLLTAGVTANQTTFFSAIFLCVSFIPLMFTQFWYSAFVSALFLFISYIMDYADGEVARYRGSRYLGRLMDVASHDIFYAVFIFLGFGLYFRTLEPFYILAGMSATVSILLARLHQIRLEYMNFFAKVTHENGRLAKAAYRITLANTFLPVMYILSVFDLSALFLVFYAVYNPLFWLVWFARKGWFNEKDAGKSNETDVWKEIEKHV